MAMSQVHYKKRLEEIKQQKIIKGQIVFVGDCLIEGFDLPTSYEGQVIYNHGINGDDIESLLATLYKRVIKYKPSKVVISIGGHDLRSHTNVRTVYEQIAEMLKIIKTRSKETEIFLLSVTPVNIAHEPFINREMVEQINNKDVELLNYYLRNYSRKANVTFVDITKELKNDFYQLTLSYTNDGFHLNQEGYQVVRNMLSRYA